MAISASCQKYKPELNGRKGISFQVILIGILLTIQASVFAQKKLTNAIEQYYFTQDRIATGLVFDILQDTKGFMWFATEYGLIKYDGKHLETFKSIPRDTNSLAGDVISRLTEDQDGKLWVGTMFSGLHRFDPYTETFTCYQYDPLNAMSLSNNQINDIVVDDEGNIWVATNGGGVNLFDEKSGGFHHFKHQGEQEVAHKSDFVFDILDVNKNKLWIATDQGLESWDINQKNVTHSRRLPSPANKDLGIKTLTEDHDSNFWIGTKNHGLFKLQADIGQYVSVHLPVEQEEPDVNHIWRILEDKQDNIWVATDGGLFYIVVQDKTDQSSAFGVSEFKQLPVQRALSLCESRDGLIWVGTNNGVIVLAPRYKKFHHFKAVKNNEVSPRKRGITTIDQDKDGIIWVGTTSGLFQFDQKEMRLHQDFLSGDPGLRYFAQSHILALYTDSRNNIWVSIGLGFNLAFQVLYYEKNTKTLNDYTRRWPPFQTHAVHHITETPENNLWFSNGMGLARYIISEDSFTIYQYEPEDTHSIGSNYIHMTVGSNKNVLWIGTNDTGLDKMDIAAGKFHHYYPAAGEPNAISNKRVKYLLEDNNTVLWLGTAGGLNRLDPITEEFQSFSTEQGLPENLVKTMLQDENGDIWLSTPHWLSRVDVKTETVVNYGLKDGMQIDEFQAKKSLRDSSGRLYFGADNGLVVFHPDSIQPNPFITPVVLTDFWLLNKRLRPNPQSKTLAISINFAKQITLGPKENVFTFHFAALSYINPQQNSFAYQLEGFDSDWQMVGNRTEATYTNLRYGRYKFKVKAGNNDRIWNEQETSIQLTILPPWYHTWWAYSLFSSLLLTALWFLYHFQLRRQLQLTENIRLKELDAVKTRFYTNISHEFRTPLTIILGLADQLKAQASEGLKSGLKMIQRNGQQLLHLVNQMLDLSKLESGKMPVHWVQSDIIQYLRYLQEAFHSLATNKDIRLHFLSNIEILNMDFDPEKLSNIISNLMTNAIKFSPEGGDVYLQVQKIPGHIQISVKDKGIGIPVEKLPRIFERFYQADDSATREGQGTGVGLALTKELVKLVQGEISVKSNHGKGSEFIVQLPIRNMVETPSTFDKNKIKSAVLPTVMNTPRTGSLVEMAFAGQEEGPLLLIIEDNPDITSYLTICLEKDYRLISAPNGKEGVDKASKEIPDLIISDVMMPEKDGFEVCDILKNDERTSHIPIILLTAKADIQSKLHGLQSGADAYLAKPFQKEELQIRIRKLIDLRHKLQQHYLLLAASEQAKVTLQEEPPMEKAEHAFVQKVQAIVEQHIGDFSFNVESLCREVGMSQSQLYRKLSALTGYSAQQFMRFIRLSKAKAMLLESNLTIAAVAYDTGFADPDYFSKVFKKEFGITPSEFRST